MKTSFSPTLIIVCAFAIFSCGSPSDNSNLENKDTDSVSNYSALAKQLMENAGENPFTITLVPETLDYYLPALHSFAEGTYNEFTIILGGQVVGFHGTSNNPPPFLTSFANDSLWVIDFVNGASQGVPIPKEYWSALAATNSQSYQVGNDLYMCGGYTVSDSTQQRFNTTSDFFFKVNIPSFVAYVRSGGTSPSLTEVFPVAINNDFVKVAGGELIVVNNNFYLVGGQDYEGAYSAGRNGKYTNAIRSFTLEQNGDTWALANMDSLVDSTNLHRRDFNLVPFIAADSSIEAIVYGGVFTPDDLSYNNPIYIKGLSTGKPTITIGTSQQKCNQYTCAVAPMYFGQGEIMSYAMIGGISYMKYDADSGRLIVGDYVGNFNMPMPFSNLVNFMITNGDNSIEYVQTPPAAMLPTYVGSNASFLPFQQYRVDGFENILDVNKVLSSPSTSIKVGYLYGGILSDAATTTNPSGHVNTYANPVLYSVLLSFDENKIK